MRVECPGALKMCSTTANARALDCTQIRYSVSATHTDGLVPMWSYVLVFQCFVAERSSRGAGRAMFVRVVSNHC